MRVAVFSDIHGNCVGLDAVLADLERHPADQTICLGDAIQGGPQPRQVVERLQDLGCPVIMGNADSWVVTGEFKGSAEAPPGESAIEAKDWTLSQLDSDQVKFIEGFEPTVELDLGGKLLFAFHGSPHSFDDIILPETEEDEFQKLLEGFEAAAFTGGHTHMQWIRRLGDSFYFNPGSAGLAYNRNADPETFRFDPWAEYAVVGNEGGRVTIEFRRVPYDVDALIKAFEVSGMPNAEHSAARHKP